MQAIEVFRARHQFAREIFYDDLWGRYTDTQMRTPPHASMNSLVWVLWHVARVEDSGVNRFVTRTQQVLHRGNWNEQLGITTEHFGFGSTREEMLQISETIDIAALRAYWQAVVDDTMNAVGTLNVTQLDDVLSEDEVREVLFVEGVALPDMTEAVPIYTGWTRLEALFHFSVTHYYWHGGEVRTLEGVLR